MKIDLSSTSGTQMPAYCVLRTQLNPISIPTSKSLTCCKDLSGFLDMEGTRDSHFGSGKAGLGTHPEV